MAATADFNWRDLISGVSITQLIDVLNRISDAESESDAARDTLARAASDLEGDLNSVRGTRDQMAELARILGQRITGESAPIEWDEDAIRQRESEYFSRMAPSVDRAASLAASQGFAGVLRRGMADSTAADQALGDLTRQYADVYSRLRENARGTAFQEAFNKFRALSENRANDQRNAISAFGAVTPALQNSNGTLVRSGTDRVTSATEAVTEAARNRGDQYARALDSNLGRGVSGAIDKAAGALIDRGLDWLLGPKNTTSGYDYSNYDVNAASNARLLRQQGAGETATNWDYSDTDAAGNSYGGDYDPWGDLSHAESFVPEPAPVASSTDWEMPVYEWDEPVYDWGSSEDTSWETPSYEWDEPAEEDWAWWD